MTVSVHHPRLGAAAKQWLVWLADPATNAPAPEPTIALSELSALLLAAELHGVLPLCLAGLRRPGAAHCGASGASTSERETMLAAAGLRAAELLGFQMRLQHFGGKAEQSLEDQGIPFIPVKGRTFAERLYAHPTLRPYTDIDLLIPLTARDAVGTVLQAHGFALHTMEYRGTKDYFEDKWLHDSNPDVMIEVHCDLVHNPKLRAAFSLTYADVLAAGDGDGADATALLLVACAHGAASHQFDRLQHVLDVTQCARGAAGAIDVGRLRRVAGRCGLTLACAGALSLAGRMFREPHCLELARQLVPGALDRAASGLLTPGLVLDARSDDRSAASWRRKLFRQALRLAARRR